MKLLQVAFKKEGYNNFVTKRFRCFYFTFLVINLKYFISTENIYNKFSNHAILCLIYIYYTQTQSKQKEKSNTNLFFIRKQTSSGNLDKLKLWNMYNTI